MSVLVEIEQVSGLITAILIMVALIVLIFRYTKSYSALEGEKQFDVLRTEKVDIRPNVFVLAEAYSRGHSDPLRGVHREFSARAFRIFFKTLVRAILIVVAGLIVGGLFASILGRAVE